MPRRRVADAGGEADRATTLEQRVDRGVAGDVDRAADTLSARGWRRPAAVGANSRSAWASIARAIFLLGPRQMRVVGPKARLDMRDRNAGGEAGERGAERARRVALDDQQVGRRPSNGRERRGDRADVRVRVFLAGAIELRPRG